MALDGPLSSRFEDVWDAWSFFKMLDLDESGAVDMEEFLMGCLRVRGAAKAIDISKRLGFRPAVQVVEARNRASRWPLRVVTCAQDHSRPDLAD